MRWGRDVFQISLALGHLQSPLPQARQEAQEAEVAAAVLALLHLHVPPYLFSTTVMEKALGPQLVGLSWDTVDSLEAGPSCELTQGDVAIFPV